MADNVYEGLFIFDSNRYARDPGGVSGQIAAMVQKYGGKVLASRLWEERRLAYAIGGQRKGTYWLAYFRLESTKLDAMRRDCRINDNILRELMLKVDARIVDALVSHALASASDAAAKARQRAPAAVATAEVAVEAAVEETTEAG
ncbi:MAG: 30S ribosomal protein S6 [Planctomycetia bacterium]|nr:30S ribosomal protein S6 [Planctomycetia bacterium]